MSGQGAWKKIVQGIAHYQIDETMPDMMEIVQGQYWKGSLHLEQIGGKGLTPLPVQVINDSMSNPTMLLDTQYTSLKWTLDLPSPSFPYIIHICSGDFTDQHLVLPNSKKKLQGMIKKMKIQNVSVETLSDDQTEDQTEEGDLPPIFLAFQIYKADLGKNFACFSEDSEDSDSEYSDEGEEGALVGEESRKRGCLVPSVSSQRATKKAKNAKDDKLKPNDYYGFGDPLLEWELCAATLEHFVGRAMTRFAGLNELVNAGVVLPASLTSEFNNYRAHNSKERAIDVEDGDDQNEDVKDNEEKIDHGHTSVQGGVQGEAVTEVKSEDADVHSSPDIAGLDNAGLDNAGPDIAGLDELFKGIDPKFKISAVKWFIEEGLSSVQALVELDALDAFFGKTGMNKTLAQMLVRKRLRCPESL